MKKRVLVYGWYGSKNTNIGDLLFKDAFIKLFPQFDFTFVDLINEGLANSFDIFFFGGGSFLDSPPNISLPALNIIKTKKLFYIGVGADGNINQVHQDLIKHSLLIALRSDSQFVRELNINTILIPDIVYSLKPAKIKQKEKSNSILILPNINIIPKHNESLYKYNAFESFKTEMAQFCDALIEKDYIVDFLAMCENIGLDDTNCAIEIINRMINNKSPKIIKTYNILEALSDYDLIITQRLHGIILSQMAETPYIAISHHDKLNNFQYKTGAHIDYYGVSKNILLRETFKALKWEGRCFTDIEFFKELCVKINELLD